jgi:drug/metabolite transporter (DMT)-like permease
MDRTKLLLALVVVAVLGLSSFGLPYLLWPSISSGSTALPQQLLLAAWGALAAIAVTWAYGRYIRQHPPKQPRRSYLGLVLLGVLLALFLAVYFMSPARSVSVWRYILG